MAETVRATTQALYDRVFYPTYPLGMPGGGQNLSSQHAMGTHLVEMGVNGRVFGTIFHILDA